MECIEIAIILNAKIKIESIFYNNETFNSKRKEEGKY